MGMSKLDPDQKMRRRALKRAKAYDYSCDRCGVGEGWPCQNTGRSKVPGSEAKNPHKCRMNRALGYLMLRDWKSPGTSSGDTKLFTGLAMADWARWLEKKES